MKAPIWQVLLHRFTLRAGAVGFVLLVWELTGRTILESRLPPVTSVFQRLIVELGSEQFWVASRITMTALTAGLAFSLLGGITFGLLNGSITSMERMTRVFVRALVALPIAPLIPVLISIFGLGAAVRIAAITVFAWPIVVEYTTDGVRAASRSLSDMARSFRVSRWKRYTKVILPGAAPGILAGVRLGVGRAVVGMVVAELIIVSTGLGALLRRAQALFQPEAVFAYVVVFLAIGLVLVRAVALIEDRMVHWE